MSHQPPEPGERQRRFPGKVWAALPHVVRGFGIERLLLRGAALTYLSIVSLVPLVAVVLLALQALQLVDLQQPIRDFLFENLAVGARESLGAALEQVLDNAGAGTEGTFGGLLLLGSALLLLRNIERAFDDLWGLHAPRPLASALPRYLGLLLAGPVVLGISLAATAALRAWADLFDLPFERALLGLVPLAISTAGFVALYKIAPAAKVRWRPALVAGAIAAATWEVAKLLFGLYAAYAVRTDYLYGSLVAIPIFLVWVYVTWLIVLFGGRLAFTIQHPRDVLRLTNDETRARVLELCAARVAVALARVQLEGGAGPTVHHLAVQLGLPEGMVRSLVPLLETAGLLRSEKRRIELAAPANRTSVGAVLRAVRGRLDPRDFGPDPTVGHLLDVLEGAEDLAAESLDDRLLADLARIPGASGGVPLAKA